MPKIGTEIKKILSRMKSILYKSLFFCFLFLKFTFPTFGQTQSYTYQILQWDTVSILESPGGKIVKLTQSYQNIPIWRAQAWVFIHSLGESFQQNNYCKKSALVYSFPLSDSKVNQEFVHRYLIQQNYSTGICSQKPVWFPLGDSLLPAIQFITCPGSQTANREIVVHALSPIVLSDESRLAFATQDTTVRATVFNPDPLTKAGVSYGGNYTDQNDGDVPELNAMRDTVSLRITLVNDTFYLKGDYIELKDIELPYDLPVRQDHPNFYFTRAQQGFEDVTVYYHLQQYQHYIQSLGYTNLCNFPFWVDPHGMNGADNSYFSPGSNPFDGYISFGEGGVDDAEDADVIVHEYGHALSDAAAPGTNFGTERRGLDEGICDYIAASYSKDLYQFKWNELYTWDGHNEFWAGRMADQNLIYPISSSNIYNFGSLWVTVMMEIRQALGATLTDRLQLQALYLNVGNLTLPQAARNIIIADTALYGGIHTPTLLQYFCTRQLITGAECNGINRWEDTSQEILTIYPNPSKQKFFISGNDLPWEVSDLSGKIILRGNKEEIDLGEFPNGVYLLKVGNKVGKLIRE